MDPAIGEAGDIDTSLVMLTFENGVVVTVDNSRKATYGYDQRVEVFGSKVRCKRWRGGKIFSNLYISVRCARLRKAGVLLIWMDKRVAYLEPKPPILAHVFSC